MSTSAQQAINYLQLLQLSPARAIDSLRATSSSVEILSLFKHYFPRELKKLASFDDALPVFLSLVDKRLFPISEMDFEESMEYLSEQIPLDSINDDWWERDIDDLNAFDRAVLAGMMKPDENGSFDPWNLPRLDYKKVGQKSTGPLKNLVDAIRFFLHDTGNSWCDVSQEEAGQSYYEWSVENVDLFAAIWKEAKPILKRVSGVYRYTEQHPEALERVTEIVAGAVIKEREQKLKTLAEALDDHADELENVVLIPL